jgi:hypothetical protein
MMEAGKLEKENISHARKIVWGEPAPEAGDKPYSHRPLAPSSSPPTLASKQCTNNTEKNNRICMEVGRVPSTLDPFRTGKERKKAPNSSLTLPKA